MPNIWHLAHQITKTTLHQLLQISKNLRHGYSTVSNMRRYGEKCYTLFTLFNPFFLSPSIRYLSCLSVSFSRSLCSGMPLPLHLSLSLFWIADLTTPISPSPISPRRETETARLATDHNPLCDEEELQCEGHGGRK